MENRPQNTGVEKKSFIAKAEAADGWLTRKEAVLLFEKAKKIGHNQAIVEIGSWKGRSTICLASGSLEGEMGTVYAVDPHTGSYEHTKLFPTPINTLGEFKRNITAAGVDSLVTLLHMTSEKASADFKKPVGLIFIDGSHVFEDVQNDIRCWFNKVADRGILAFHDTGHSFSGPRRATTRLLLSRHVRKPGMTDTITYMEKVKKNSFKDRVENVLFLIRRSFWLGPKSLGVLRWHNLGGSKG